MSAQGSLKKTAKSVDTVIADGTGFSYNDVYPLNFFRGKDIREVKAHVRVVAIIGVIDKKRVIISTNAGGAYASEVRLALPIVDEIKPFCSHKAGGFFIADKCYDSIELMKRLASSGITPAIKVKETMRAHVRNELRKLSKFYANQKQVYSKRYLIESLFGTIKQKLGSHIRVKRDDIAIKFALIRVLIFNLCVALHNSPKIFLFYLRSLIFVPQTHP